MTFAFECLDPISDVSDDDLGLLGNMGVLDVTGRILRQIEDCLKDHPLGTDQPSHATAPRPYPVPSLLSLEIAEDGDIITGSPVRE